MKKDNYNINIAQDAAKMCDRSDNLVRKVLRSKRNNEVIILAVAELKEGYDQVKERTAKKVKHFIETGSYDFEHLFNEENVA